MIESACPVIPGMMEPEADPDILAREAEKIGYPVLIKAAAGGGGKGMRIVQDPGRFREAAVSASREARSAFGNGDIYLEKYLDKARHVEFQILADRQGNVVHLLERECSIQRRHQKIIEETPSPALTPTLREEMGKAAVAAAKAAGYVNAGTVEFLARRGGQILFSGGQHPAPGGASHHRNDHGHRPGAAADRDCRGRPPELLPGRYRRPRPCHRMPHLCRRSPERLPAVVGQNPFCQGAAGARHQERQRHLFRLHRPDGVRPHPRRS